MAPSEAKERGLRSKGGVCGQDGQKTGRLSMRLECEGGGGAVVREPATSPELGSTLG